MKRMKKLFALVMTVAMVFTMAFATVGVNAATKKKSTTVKVGAYTVNTEKKTVSFKVTVNENMLGKPVVHFIINDKNGDNKTGNAGAGLFTTKGTALDLYKALVKAGATPWVGKTGAVGSLNVGDKLEDVAIGNLGFPGFSRLSMTFKKDGVTYKPADLVNYEYLGAGAGASDPFQMCFSGNYENQKAWNTGCVACLFSCYAGVTSNAAIGCGTVGEGGDNCFTSKDALKAGDVYTVTYTVKKAPYNYITAKKLKANMSDYKVIDVRKAEDSAKGHIKGAEAAPVSVEEGATDYDGRANLQAVVKKYGKNKKYVLCCYSGNNYAKKATDILINRCGVKASNIYTLVGGWNNWSAKYPYQFGKSGNIMVDPVKKTVKLDAYVNSTIHMNQYDDQTHHFVVNENGSNGDKCVFPTEAKPLDVYNAMVAVGATPENNQTNLCEASHEAGQFLEGTGSKVKISVSWNKKTTTKKNGKKVTKTTKVTKSMAQCLKRLNGQAYDDSKMEFAGCFEMYNDAAYGKLMNKSGCITCTFSCWIGTCSNAAYAYSSEEVMPNRSVLPKAGTPVTVTYQF